jgi:hypothetical protein
MGRLDGITDRQREDEGNQREQRAADAGHSQRL